MPTPSLSWKTAHRFATKTSSSPLTSGTLFNWYGSIEIAHIIGRVTTAIQAQATTIKLSMVADALGAYDLCTAKDANAFAVGSLISITGTAADAVVSTTGVGTLGPGQANPIVATCIVSGTLTVTYGAPSTGSIAWEVLWRPLTRAGVVIPA